MSVQVDLKDPLDRLNKLYYIVDKSGKKVQFQMNWAQKKLYDQFWHMNIVLKARQLGLTTLSTLILLDAALWTPNISAGIIAHSKEDVEMIFRTKVKYAFDHIPEPYKQIWTASTDNARELVFNNGSSIRVGRSMRSATLQLLHVSEFAKICREYPEKAREIVTGALNTVQTGNKIIIESTAEGREGYFYEMCMEALNNKLQKKQLTELDFRFHFFPWHEEPSYRLKDNETTVYPQPMLDYFEKLKINHGIKLHKDQKLWYYKKYTTQGEDMWSEYPSIPEESFQASTEGCYYSKWITALRAKGQICHVPYEPALPVNTAWDLGFNDYTCIWFWQESFGGEIRIIDYYENSFEPLTHYIKYVKDLPYIYGRHFAPHDIAVRELSSGNSRLLLAKQLGINFYVTKKTDIQDGIETVRNILPRCWFDETKVGDTGLRRLENYRKEWNARIGAWSAQPVHDINSHGSDAFRYLALNINKGSVQKFTPEDEQALWLSSGGI